MLSDRPASAAPCGPIIFEKMCVFKQADPEPVSASLQAGTASDSPLTHQTPGVASAQPDLVPSAEARPRPPTDRQWAACVLRTWTAMELQETKSRQLLAQIAWLERRGSSAGGCLRVWSPPPTPLPQGLPVPAVAVRNAQDRDGQPFITASCRCLGRRAVCVGAAHVARGMAAACQQELTMAGWRAASLPTQHADPDPRLEHHTEQRAGGCGGLRRS